MTSPWKKFDDHIRLAVRLTPNGGRNAVDGIEADGEGGMLLKVRVTAVPEKGKANKALIVLVSKSLGIDHKPARAIRPEPDNLANDPVSSDLDRSEMTLRIESSHCASRDQSGDGATNKTASVN